MKNMIIFIDESGDSGFKIQKGSSSHFVISLVIFDDTLEAEKTAIKIKEFKRTKKLSDYYEIKFNKLKKSLKIEFLETIKDSKFRVRSIVVEKEIIYSTALQTDKRKYYSFFLKKVLEKNNNTILNAKLRLDGLGEREFKKAMTSYLRRELNHDISNKIMDNLKFVDSKKDVLIQLADMVAGSIRRSFETDKTDQKIYKDIIKERIEDEWRYK